MTSGIEVADAAGEEVEQVARLLLFAFAEHLAVFPSEAAGSYRTELADVSSRLPLSELILARRQGQLLGSVTFLPDAERDAHPWPPGGAVLRLLAVRPEARRKGVGELLTRECIRRARLRGAAFLGLHTAPFMLEAGRLYERLGFRRIPEYDFDATLHYGRRLGPAGGEAATLSGLAYCLPLAGEQR